MKERTAFLLTFIMEIPERSALMASKFAHVHIDTLRMWLFNIEITARVSLHNVEGTYYDSLCMTERQCEIEICGLVRGIFKRRCMTFLDDYIHSCLTLFIHPLSGSNESARATVGSTAGTASMIEAVGTYACGCCSLVSFFASSFFFRLR